MKSANLGEWSELYVLTQLLSEGGGYLADSNQNPIPTRFLKALRLFLEGDSPKSIQTFVIKPDSVEIRSGTASEAFVDRRQISNLGKRLLSELQSKNFQTESVVGNQLLEVLRRTRPAASSQQSIHDMQIEFDDEETQNPTQIMGFSIKSQLGSASTLLNASSHTNLTFRICTDAPLSDADIESLNNQKILATMARLRELGCELQFCHYDSEQFRDNLGVIDSRLEEYLGALVAASYLNNISAFDAATQHVYPSDLKTSRQPRYKLKEFLGAVSMGLRPSKNWEGDPAMFKGLILAKEDGKVLFYYLYNILEFRDFLFQNLRFEQASTTRHGYGQIYREHGEVRIKLNLQLRFKR